MPSGSEGLPARIECTTYYRPLGDESTQGSAEQTLVLDVSGNARVSQSAEFEAMRIEFRLDASDVGESTAFTVAVSTPSGEALTSVLYQLGTVRLDAVEFAGGHGFTGLHYVDHQGAQLQFWCSAE